MSEIQEAHRKVQHERDQIKAAREALQELQREHDLTIDDFEESTRKVRQDMDEFENTTFLFQRRPPTILMQF